MPMHDPAFAAPALGTALTGLATLLGCTLVHYECLSHANDRLPALALPARAKVLAVLAAAFVAHALEVGLYALAYRLLAGSLGVGALAGGSARAFDDCLYFSAQTYTSLGFGDFTPLGPLRLLASIEALNGLLMVGWSASTVHLAMERWWRPRGRQGR